MYNVTNEFPLFFQFIAIKIGWKVAESRDVILPRPLIYLLNGLNLKFWTISFKILQMNAVSYMLSMLVNPDLCMLLVFWALYLYLWYSSAFLPRQPLLVVAPKLKVKWLQKCQTHCFMNLNAVLNMLPLLDGTHVYFVQAWKRDLNLLLWIVKLHALMQ